MRKIDFVEKLNAGIAICRKIRKLERHPAGKVFMEIGTGRIPLAPLAYWLMGAEKTITMDLNPYVKLELIRESLSYIYQKKEKIKNLFGGLLEPKRFDTLLSFAQNPNFSTAEFLDFSQIEYLAPANAASTGLPSQSIDFHTSYTVFEHIPPGILLQILEEGNRLVGKDGLFIHNTDYSDHFSHSDRKIPSINFLQFSDQQWRRYAGNKYSYMNRLRHDDLIRLFRSVGHEILLTETKIDKHAAKLLRNDAIELNERFRNKSKEILSINGSWIISRRAPIEESDESGQNSAYREPGRQIS